MLPEPEDLGPDEYTRAINEPPRAKSLAPKPPYEIKSLEGKFGFDGEVKGSRGSLFVFTDGAPIRYPPTLNAPALVSFLEACRDIRRRVNCIEIGRTLVQKKADYERAFPETKQGKRKKVKKVGIHPGLFPAAPSFVSACAHEIGVSESQIYKWMKIGSLTAEDASVIEATPVRSMPYFAHFVAIEKDETVKKQLLATLQKDGPKAFTKAIDGILLQRNKAFEEHRTHEKTFEVGAVFQIDLGDGTVMMEVKSIAPGNVTLRWTAPHHHKVDVSDVSTNDFEELLSLDPPRDDDEDNDGPSLDDV